MGRIRVAGAMIRPLLLASITMLVLAGCAAPEGELPAGEVDSDAVPSAGGTMPTPTPATTPKPTGASGTSAPPTDEMANDAVGDGEEGGDDEPAKNEPATPAPTPATVSSAGAATPPATSTPSASSGGSAPPVFDMTPTTAAPAGDSDRDGIPDSLERSLATSCAIEGRTCAELGLSPPKVGTRDLVFLQVGRSGPMQNWRYSAAIWDGVKQELANLSIHVQVADLGQMSLYDADARWSDTSRDGRFWTLYVIYNDPATAITDDASGSQTFDQITLAERGDPVEERATILHEAYHALLGNLDGGYSTCANEEIGGPSHSADAGSVLYTSPDCETNEGSVYRLGIAELRELREKPFSVLTEMNEPGWTEAAMA